MELIEQLQSKSAPKIKKAAVKIAKEKLTGYEEPLTDALKYLMLKPKSWQTQSKVIQAIGVTGSAASIPYLKELTLNEYEATVLYKDLGFSICLLEDIPNANINYLKSVLSSKNNLLISGVCSALLYSEFIPSNDDIIVIMNSIIEITEDEGQIITPRCYIAALAYLWPKNITNSFLEQCLKSNWNGLVEIAKSSIEGKKTRYVLV